MSAAEKLRQAKALIENPARWCQGNGAVADDGAVVDFDSPEAHRWCARGAVSKVTNHRPNTPVYNATVRFLDRAANELHAGFNSVQVNDQLNHRDVMKMFRRAIRLAQKADNAEEQT